MNDVPSTLKMPLPEQIIAGRYRLISRLGSGGMALVFLAEQLGVGNRVALKFLEPDPSGDDDSRVSRFLREAKVALEVQHPGATQILDLGRDEEQRLFIAFEVVEGEDLREVLKREGRLRFTEARTIAVQIAQVLAFAHGRGIVHRDVKPENVRLRRDVGTTHVKLLDFGIARLLKKNDVRLTAEGTLAGTPRYMAPEQVNDEAIDGRADQYALGLVLFEMLTGAVAIGGKNVAQILRHQLQTLVPPLAWADPALGNAELDAFIARACAKDPRERFPSMAEFISALQALHVDERAWPPPAGPPPAQAIGSTALTRDQKPGSQPEPELGDTEVRRPASTDYEPRVEVPTDPMREPVKRREPSPEPGTDPHHPAVARGGPVPAPAPLLLTASNVIEMPTQPERPAVVRAPAREPIKQTVRGELKPPAPPRRTPWGLIIGGVLLALAALSAAAWWWR